MTRAKIKAAIRTVIAAQGWNDKTVGVLACEFISEHNLSGQFLDFLEEHAYEEYVASGGPLPYTCCRTG